MQPQNQPRPVSVPPAANVPLPPFPQRCPSDQGSEKQVQAENANALHKNSSDSETRDRLQDIDEELYRRIGPSRCRGITPIHRSPSRPRLSSRPTANVINIHEHLI